MVKTVLLTYLDPCRFSKCSRRLLALCTYDLLVITMTTPCARVRKTYFVRTFGHTHDALNKEPSASVGSVGDLRVSQALGLVTVLVLATL